MSSEGNDEGRTMNDERQAENEESTPSPARLRMRTERSGRLMAAGEEPPRHRGGYGVVGGCRSDGTDGTDETGEDASWLGCGMSRF